MKDYKKILEDIVNIINTTEKNDIGFANICTYISENCSELKESEDENIRKWLIFYLQLKSDGNNFMIDKAIAWLKKQGEQKQDPCVHCDDKCLNCHNFPCIKKRAFEQDKSVFEVINEEKVDNVNKVEPKDYSSIDPHFGKPIDKVETKDYNNIDPHFGKPADKVEPKFHEGQWIVWQGKNFKVNYNGCGYELTDQNGVSISLEYGAIDKTANLWRIQDAKAGDVLYSPKEPVVERIVLIGGWKQLDKDCGKTLCSSVTYRVEEDEIEVGGVGAIWWNGKINSFYPATKEQRELLFHKMKEAGYEWDADKKELRKIEKNPTNKVRPKFKVGDWIIGKATNNEPRQISEITDQCYKSTYGGQYGFSFEDELHLWSIKDAKAGDVIYSKHNTEDFEWMGIFKSLDKENKGVHLYGFWNNMTKTFKVCGNEIFVLYNDFSPATKEQRNMLMEAITEAGYEWDANELEAKKIENVQELAEKNLAWNENDDIMLHDIIDYFENRTLALPYDVFLYIPWLKSLRNRINCKADKS